MSTSSTATTNNTNSGQTVNNKRAHSIDAIFVKRHLQDYIWFVWEVSPQSLKDAFAKKGVELNTDADVQTLINLYLSGNDKKGTVTNAQGQKLRWNTKKVFETINIPIADLNGAGSKVKWVQ